PEGGNINMMHGDSRVMVVVCLDSQFTSTLSVNFHFPKIPRRTEKIDRSITSQGHRFFCALFFHCSVKDLE
ncbi:hypothetical protein VCX44_23700, partial [Aeromonas caviae]